MKRIFSIVKAALLVLLLVFIVWDLRGDSLSDADPQKVAEAVAKAGGFGEISPAEARMIKRFYGVNPNDYEGAVLYAPADNMDAHELFVVKMKDVSQKEALEKAINERLDTQLKSFEGYGAEQTALLKKHVLLVQGNFALYVVGEKATDAQKAFLDSL